MNPDVNPNDQQYTPQQPAQQTPAEAPQQQPQPQGPNLEPTTYPGKSLGIASFIVSLLGVSLVGLILGIVALTQSKKAGHKNGFALASIILGAIGIVVGIIGISLLIAAGSAVKNNTTCTTETDANGVASQHCTLGS